MGDEQPAAGCLPPPPDGSPTASLPAVVRGRLVLPDEAKAKEQRQVKKLLRSIRMTEARALLIKVADSTIEFQRRVNLVRAFDVCREMGLSGSDFCRRLRITESTMRDWSARAKAQGFDSLRPWKGRAMTDSERAIIEGK